MKRKHFRIFRIDKLPGISYYIVKQRIALFFWGSSPYSTLSDITEKECDEYYDTYDVCEYKQFTTIEKAEEAIQDTIIFSTYPRTTYIS